MNRATKFREIGKGEEKREGCKNDTVIFEIEARFETVEAGMEFLGIKSI